MSSRKWSIGVLSDTHGHLPQEVFEHFAGCDEIWHAGDIGAPHIIEQLTEQARVRAVYGNIDNALLRKSYPERFFFEIGGLKVLLIHIAGPPSAYYSAVQAYCRKKKVDIVVCGHTHILKVVRDHLGGLYINPGAAGKQGIHQVRTLLRFDIIDQKLTHMQAIELPPH